MADFDDNEVINEHIQFRGGATFEDEPLATEQASITEGGAYIYQTTDQTISTGTSTTVTFDTEDTNYTPGDVLTVDLANNKITLEVDGRYVLVGGIRYQNLSDGTRMQTRFNIGGSIRGVNSIPIGAAAIAGFPSLEIWKETTSPTDVTFEAFHDSGVDDDTRSGEGAVFLSVGRIG